jgi:hypothetical protein
MERARMAFVVTVFSLLALGGCEPPIEGPTAIVVENGPTFSLRGQGNLARFTVYAPVRGTKIANPFDPSSAVWEIEGRPKGLLEGVSIEGLRLVYAKAPRGYTQTVPENSQAVPHLAPERIYSFEAWSTLAGELGGDFYVDKTGAAQAVELGTCGVSTGHGVVTTNCETHEPLRESADIDKYAREHLRASAFTPLPKTDTSSECKPETTKPKGR